MAYMSVFASFMLFLPSFVQSLDNGLALTPPMGWLTWARFACTTDCIRYPTECISEKMIKEMTDEMVSGGFKDAGYEYVIIDDCWLASTRDQNLRLQPDPKRFPSGIRALADYVHSKGLKFGIYGDIGTRTCQGYPGNEYYLQLDAQTYADWTVDYFKLDGCNAFIQQFEDAFPAMGMWLNRTGRPMLYSCCWPCYQEGKMQPNYRKIAESCNIWRNYHDVLNSWDSIIDIVTFYGDDKTHFVEVAGPGHFNDPDMLIIGNSGLNRDQQRVQMALWSIMAAPLIMSNDLRNINDYSKALLQNRGALAINQDKLGIQGRRIKTQGSVQIWTRPILPEGSWAFAFLNAGKTAPSAVSVLLSDLGFTDPAGYNVTEVFDGVSFGSLKPNSWLKVSVNPTGVFFGKAVKL